MQSRGICILMIRLLKSFVRFIFLELIFLHKSCKLDHVRTNDQFLTLWINHVLRSSAASGLPALYKPVSRISIMERCADTLLIIQPSLFFFLSSHYRRVFAARDLQPNPDPFHLQRSVQLERIPPGLSG